MSSALQHMYAKQILIYPFLIVLGAQLRNINDSCLQPQKSLGPLNRSNLTLSLVGGGGAVWGDVGRAASTSSPTRTQPDRTHRSAASRRTHEDGRKPEDERGGFHNKSRVFFLMIGNRINLLLIMWDTVLPLHMSVHSDANNMITPLTVFTSFN